MRTILIAGAEEAPLSPAHDRGTVQRGGRTCDCGLSDLPDVSHYERACRDDVAMEYGVTQRGDAVL